MIKKEIRNIIEQKLYSIENEYRVTILLAVESGSRAWGFESLDSDYDVRFIYKHEKEWYLKILPERDVIEIPIENLMDYSGWDLRKSFFLMNKSNPVLYEWMKSPIIYKKNEIFYNLFNDVSEEYFSKVSTIYHYLHMAKKNYKEYLKRDYVKSKKYFYVLRPLLACEWVELKSSPPPMEFETLLNELLRDNIIRNEVDVLLIKKKSGLEMGEIPRIDLFNEYIEEKIDYFENKVKDYDPLNKPPTKKMDEAFRKILEM